MTAPDTGGDIAGASQSLVTPAQRSWDSGRDARRRRPRGLRTSRGPHGRFRQQRLVPAAAPERLASPAAGLGSGFAASSASSATRSPASRTGNCGSPSPAGAGGAADPLSRRIGCSGCGRATRESPVPFASAGSHGRHPPASCPGWAAARGSGPSQRAGGGPTAATSASSRREPRTGAGPPALLVGPALDRSAG